MEIIDVKYKMRCEMGACKNFAAVSLKMSRVGIRSQIHLCDECMNEIYSLIGSRVIPKSIETCKKMVSDYTISPALDKELKETDENEKKANGGEKTKKIKLNPVKRA